jgi:uracil-DNA glycosylase family 4
MLKPSPCKTCILYNLGTSFTAVEGKGRSGVMLIGEAAAHDDAIDGLPFRPHSQGGSKLEECIKLNGMSRDDFIITSIVRCQPPDSRLSNIWYEQRAIDTCTNSYLKNVIQEYIPPAGKRKVILAIGNTAYHVLTGKYDSVLDVRGYPFCDRYNMGITVIPTLHPSFIKRGHSNFTPLLVEDIKKAVTIASQDEWETPIMDKRQGERSFGDNYKIGEGQGGIYDDDIPF